MNEANSADSRAWLRQAYGHRGPAWEAAIEAGVDVSLLEENFHKTPQQRLEAFQDALDFIGQFSGLAAG